ncbi:hypothetical protein [Inediibacterium massiliense]|uniref:hypothetical protein n=1 Tax=Inediibacterium massiliense TaxID=1658111 RepID=UPI0006B54D35|nr:hypothetical protein [Inediibacterium massiliense]
MSILEVVLLIVALAVTLAYLYPVILLPKIILLLLSKKYGSNTGPLYKELKKSIISLILEGVLWWPIAIMATFSTDAPGTSNFHISVVAFLIYVPIFALACVIITTIAMIIESRKAKVKQD